MLQTEDAPCLACAFHKLGEVLQRRAHARMMVLRPDAVRDILGPDPYQGCAVLRLEEPGHAHDAGKRWVVALEGHFLLDLPALVELRQPDLEFVEGLGSLALFLTRIEVGQAHAIRATLAEIEGQHLAAYVCRGQPLLRAPGSENAR